VLDEFHTRIRDARVSAGLSQEEMARRIGVGRTTYINFETGQTNLFSKNLHKMAAVLGVTEEELLFGPRPDQGMLEQLTSWELTKQQLIDSYESSLHELREELDAAHRKIAKQEEDLTSLLSINNYLLNELGKQR
jgi:transcriptional regulator with XRE-family HTH domain